MTKRNLILVSIIRCRNAEEFHWSCPSTKLRQQTAKSVFKESFPANHDVSPRKNQKETDHSHAIKHCFKQSLLPEQAFQKLIFFLRSKFGFNQFRMVKHWFDHDRVYTHPKNHSATIVSQTKSTRICDMHILARLDASLIVSRYVIDLIE